MAGPPDITVSLTSLKCYAQEDTEPPIFDTEDDEPYVIALSIDVGDRKLDGLLGSASPSAFALTRIGPIEDIDKGDLKPVPAKSTVEPRRQPRTDS
jgi:hypothetical protein